jgi:hypothetical protein
MGFGGMMFGKVIREIVGSWLPVKVENFVRNFVTEPAKIHVNDAGSFLFDGVVKDTIGGAVVGLERCCRLGVTAISASATEVICFSRMELTMWMAPLSGGNGLLGVFGLER